MQCSPSRRGQSGFSPQRGRRHTGAQSPSGNAEPSQADRRITDHLRDALSLVDVRVLDHLVVGQEAVSFAERGTV